jgi:peptidoglycan/xylan/chitin deacetylase (PgdA/CDA1 family)
MLKEQDSGTRVKALTDLADWSRTGTNGRQEYRVLTDIELRRLAQGELITVGSHTMTHPTLSKLPPDRQAEEIIQSKKRLEKILGKAVTSFSYPYGSRSDYTEETVRSVKEAGYEFACSNFPDHVSRGTDVYQLPRFLVRDWDGDEFARRMRSWLRG